MCLMFLILSLFCRAMYASVHGTYVGEGSTGNCLTTFGSLADWHCVLACQSPLV